MDGVISQVQDVVEGQIDLEGQRTAEYLYTTLLSVTAIVALITGLVQQDIYLVMWVGLAGTLLTMLAVVPPWPLYNQHPLPWLGSRSKLSLSSGGIVVGSVKAT